MPRVDYAREVKIGLRDPQRLCSALGLLKHAQVQATGLLICCPAHRERYPSCSVSRAPDGTLRVKCFACDFAGDALHLIGCVHGWRTRDPDGFKEILAEGARIAGMLSLEAEIRGDNVSQEERHQPLPQPEPELERDYPPRDEVQKLWDAAGDVARDPEASQCLMARAICPAETFSRKLARVLAPDQQAPRWARYRGQAWAETGHRLILRVFDAAGRCRSVRAWRVIDSDTPKRLPPAGYRASGLVLMNRSAWSLFSGYNRCPQTILVVEGEPDFLTHATRSKDVILGLGSGSWTDEIAARIPGGSEIVVRTHHDQAGERYARVVTESLSNRCAVWRSEP